MSRIHIALDVSNLTEAVHFYQRFLGVAPFRVLNQYAQFLVEEPALNLALTEREPASVFKGHFGMEVSELPMVEQALVRAQEAGLNPEVEADILCCHARQEKFWVHDPNGHRWEVFWVRERFMEESNGETDTGCCRAG